MSIDKSKLSKFGDVKETKNYLKVYDKSLKKALIMSRCVHLEDSSKTYEGLKTRIFNEEEIKKRHMGKVKCIVKYSNVDELEKILQIYFS